MTIKRIRIGITAIAAALLVMAACAVCFAADKAVLCNTQEEASQALREAMKDRAPSAGICLVTDIAASDTEELIGDIFDGAVAHTGDPEEGDYIKFQYESCQASARPVRSDGKAAVLFTYSLTYYDTAEQEEALDEKVDGIIESLQLDGMTDEEKVRAIYGYICDNTEYDYDNLQDDEYSLKHTAYAALVDGKAVCQGYSTALYRLLLEAGVDNRIVFGTDAAAGDDGKGEKGRDHTWNIVKIGDVFYNCDVTKDDELGKDHYYLRAAGSFDEDHIRDAEYLDEAFTADHPMAEEDYGFSPLKTLSSVAGLAVNVKTLFQNLIGMW